MERTAITYSISNTSNILSRQLAVTRKSIDVSFCHKARCWFNSLFFDSKTNLGMVEAASKGEYYALEGLFRGFVNVRQLILQQVIDKASEPQKAQALVEKYFGFIYPRDLNSSSSSPLSQPVAVVPLPHVNLQLLTAIEEQNTARALQLIDADGVDINFARAGDAMTALHLAAKTGNIVLLERLLEKDAQLDAQDSEGNTFLHYAVNHYHLMPDCARLLATQGLDKTFIDISNQAGQTPLDRILWQNSPILPFACLLLRNGARKNIEQNLRSLLYTQLAEATKESRAWYLREILTILPLLTQTHGPLVRNVLNHPAVQTNFFYECIAHLNHDELVQILGYIDTLADDTLLLAVYHKHGSRIARQLLPKVQSLSPRCDEMVQAAGFSRYPLFNSELRFGLALDLLRLGVMGQNATPLLINALKEERIEDAQAILTNFQEFISGDYIDPDTQKSAIQLAAVKGIYDILLPLINDQNAHTVTIDGEENTLLHLTVLSGDIASIVLVLEHLTSDEINKTNRRGKTALRMARNERVKIVLKKWEAQDFIGRNTATPQNFLESPATSWQTPILDIDNAPEVDLDGDDIREI